MGEKLRGVNAFEPFNGFDFDDYLSFDKKIEAISAVQCLPAIDDG